MTDTATVAEHFTVVRNDEEQYSIWEADRPIPAGWHDAGVTGPKEECLAHIEEVWTDLRPRSVREEMARLAALPPVPAAAEEDTGPDLPTRLQEPQPVRVSLRPEATAGAFEKALRCGYVHIMFTGTRGGTELGVTVDESASDWARADFARGEGTVLVVGDLVLDFRPLRCFAEIDLADLHGTGHLAPAAGNQA